MKSKNNSLLEMAKAKSVEAAWSIHTRAMRDIGFDRIVYGYNRFPNHGIVGDVRDAIVLSNHGPKYMEYFVGKKMYENGPMTKWAAENEGSCSWNMIRAMADSGQLTPSQLEVCQINQKFGVTAGYTISFHGAAESEKAGIGLAARQPLTQNDVEGIWTAHHEFIELSNYLMHLKVCSLPQPSGIVRRLSARQQEVLQWAAHGKTADEMAVILDLTKSTVEKHLRLARAALDTTTTAHAVMKATSANLFLEISP